MGLISLSVSCCIYSGVFKVEVIYPNEQNIQQGGKIVCYAVILIKCSPF